MRIKRWLAAGLAMMLVLMSLSGCTPMLVQSQPERTVALPTPRADLTPEAPKGDGRADYSERVTMFYVSNDMQQLLPLTRTFWLNEDDDLVEKVMGRLLSTPGREDVKSIVPAGTKLLSSECANGIATVDLSAEVRNLSLEEQVYMRSAITNTLTRLRNIKYVNVLIGGQVEAMGESVNSMPSGAWSRGDNNLSATWMQVQSDNERFAQGRGLRQLDVSAVLYFASRQGELLLPEAHRLRLTSDELVQPILRELMNGPTELSVAKSVLPDDMKPLASVPTIVTSNDGRRLIMLPLVEQFEERIEAYGLSLKQVYGSLTLTLCRFVPEVDGMVVTVGDKRIDEIEGEYGTQTFQGGVMTVSDFEVMVSDVAEIYLGETPASSGRLKKVNRVLDPYSATRPRVLLEQLIEGPIAGEQDVAPVMPKGVSTADILGVRIEDQVALINLSSNFYRCCQELNVKGERRMVYAIVNTLTNLHGISKVRFYVEGELVDTLAQTVYVRGELIRNPGIIAEEQKNA